MSINDPMQEDEFIERDTYLESENVSRIMKRNIPSHGKITKETKDAVSDCVCDFIRYITSSDICLKDKRTRVNGDDVISALSSLGFEKYQNVLKIYLEKYREVYHISDKNSSETDILDDSSPIFSSLDFNESTSINPNINS